MGGPPGKSQAQTERDHQLAEVRAHASTKTILFGRSSPVPGSLRYQQNSDPNESTTPRNLRIAASQRPVIQFTLLSTGNSFPSTQ